MLDEEVEVLHMQNAEKDKCFAYLESRIAALEQNTRMNDFVVTGLGFM